MEQHRIDADERKKLRDLCERHVLALEDMADGATPDIAYAFLTSQGALADAARTAFPILIEENEQLKRRAKADRDQLSQIRATHGEEMAAVKIARDEALALLRQAQKERDEAKRDLAAIVERGAEAAVSVKKEPVPAVVRYRRGGYVFPHATRFACFCLALLVAQPAWAPPALHSGAVGATAAAPPAPAQPKTAYAAAHPEIPESGAFGQAQ